ncbi:membrane protein insertion efficiency factor YidD [Dokdonia sp. PRO95]|uniref:membrane protein insertion efficiency factor YidD n=1 Tax=Dokdonia sp. PRO95 TaxID=1239415 RepID=UPI000558C1A1|nr:membrane protein insertion efficiency factor YidD [Dokdonia sp. PRO95]
MASAKKIAIAPFLGIIWFYQKFISSWTPSTCRYSPTCSYYTKTAFQRHGLLTGGKLALKRILSCHPWGGQGYDPVPEKEEVNNM